MSSRNFPASFWNSNYHSHHHSTSQVYHPDTMYHHHGTAGNPADPWQTHYQQYTAAAAHHHHRYTSYIYRPKSITEITYEAANGWYTDKFSARGPFRDGHERVWCTVIFCPVRREVSVNVRGFLGGQRTVRVIINERDRSSGIRQKPSSTRG